MRVNLHTPPKHPEITPKLGIVIYGPAGHPAQTPLGKPPKTTINPPHR